MFEATAAPAWEWSPAELTRRGEALIEASDSRSPQQARPDGLAPQARGIRRLLARIRSTRTLQQIPVIVPIVLTTTAIAMPSPITVRDRHPSPATPVQRVTPTDRIVSSQDEVRYVPEHLTLAQIQELDELFALPAGSEDIIHLDE